MFTKLKSLLLRESLHWWKLWSSWLAILWGLIVTAVWNNPELLTSLVNSLPEETRAIMSPLVLGIITGLPILIRLLKQNSGEPQ